MSGKPCWKELIVVSRKQAREEEGDVEKKSKPKCRSCAQLWQMSSCKVMVVEELAVMDAAKMQHMAAHACICLYYAAMHYCIALLSVPRRSTATWCLTPGGADTATLDSSTSMK